MPTARSPNGENQGRDLVRPGAKLLKHWCARWLVKASLHGLGLASSLLDLFLDLYPFPFLPFVFLPFTFGAVSVFSGKSVN
jgi:hypothetical protein